MRPLLATCRACPRLEPGADLACLSSVTPGFCRKFSGKLAELFCLRQVCITSYTQRSFFGGVLGFDEGAKPRGACRGADHLVNTAANLLVANDDNYALAA